MNEQKNIYIYFFFFWSQTSQYGIRFNNLHQNQKSCQLPFVLVHKHHLCTNAWPGGSHQKIADELKYNAHHLCYSNSNCKLFMLLGHIFGKLRRR